MILQKTFLTLLSASLLGLSLNASAARPEITGEPTIDTPLLLAWPRDADSGLPDLTEESANRLFDLHGTIANCEHVDLVFSTAGNYHMALGEMWQELLLPRFGNEIRTWYYTTSPPISPQQITNQNVVFGNMALKCIPQVAVGPANLINTLESLGVTEGQRVPIIKNHGNVILVKKGNPKKIRSIWDLGRSDVRVVTSNPDLEAGSFNNYSTSIFEIAENNPDGRGRNSAERLFNSIFNNDGTKRRHGKHGHQHSTNKWLAGGRIHHREVPWSVAFGRADAGLMFFHLALHAVRTFPKLFEIVPLGGTVDDPQPLTGNRQATLFAVRIQGDWTGAQADAREKLMDLLVSTEFTEILERHGLMRP